MPHQIVDEPETTQDNKFEPKATQTINTTEESANMTDNPSNQADISGPDVSKLKTPDIATAGSDVSFDDTMSTRSRSSSSSLGTEMTGPPTTDEKTEDSTETKVSETSERILDVILEYSLNKFDSTAELHNKGRPKFLAIISRFVSTRQKVVMCLPAFPFKSANKVEKVLGNLPDKAEEVSLSRLNTMCATIGNFYEPGAQLTIISDGLVYNGSFILCIPHSK
jgi:hypothetical protein